MKTGSNGSSGSNGSNGSNGESIAAKAGNKKLMLIPGAVHTDLYDQTDIIPFDKITAFFAQYLS